MRDFGEGFSWRFCVCFEAVLLEVSMRNSWMFIMGIKRAQLRFQRGRCS